MINANQAANANLRCCAVPGWLAQLGHSWHSNNFASKLTITSIFLTLNLSKVMDFTRKKARILNSNKFAGVRVQRG